MKKMKRMKMKGLSPMGKIHHISEIAHEEVERHKVKLAGEKRSMRRSQRRQRFV